MDISQIHVPSLVEDWYIQKHTDVLYQSTKINKFALFGAVYHWIWFSSEAPQTVFRLGTLWKSGLNVEGIWRRVPYKVQLL